jgi:hypothetical protein
MQSGTEVSLLVSRLRLSRESNECPLRERKVSRRESPHCTRQGLLRLQSRLQILPVELPLAIAHIKRRHVVNDLHAKKTISKRMREESGNESESDGMQSIPTLVLAISRIQFREKLSTLKRLPESVAPSALASVLP